MVKIMFLFQAKKLKEHGTQRNAMRALHKDAMTKTSPLLHNIYHLFATIVSGPHSRVLRLISDSFVIIMVE